MFYQATQVISKLHSIKTTLTEVKCKFSAYKSLHCFLEFLFSYTRPLTGVVLCVWCPIPAKNPLSILYTTFDIRYNFSFAVQLFWSNHNPLVLSIARSNELAGHILAIFPRKNVREIMVHPATLLISATLKLRVEALVALLPHGFPQFATGIVGVNSRFPRFFGSRSNSIKCARNKLK